MQKISITEYIRKKKNIFKVEFFFNNNIIYQCMSKYITTQENTHHVCNNKISRPTDNHARRVLLRRDGELYGCIWHLSHVRRKLQQSGSGKDVVGRYRKGIQSFAVATGLCRWYVCAMIVFNYLISILLLFLKVYYF